MKHAQQQIYFKNQQTCGQGILDKLNKSHKLHKLYVGFSKDNSLTSSSELCLNFEI